MAYTKDVKYWKRIDTYIYEPYACTKKEMQKLLKDTEAWCADCQAVVEFETSLDITGLNNICPFCGRHLDI